MHIYIHLYTCVNKCIGQYLQTNSPDEVNVSAATRAVLKDQFEKWLPKAKIVSKATAKSNLEADKQNRVREFMYQYISM
jgi:hypothetical protein